MKKSIKIAAAAFSVFAVFALAVFLFGEIYLPASFNVYEGEDFSYRQGLLTLKKNGGNAEVSEAVAISSASSYNATVYLFDLIPIKTVRVNTMQQLEVIPGGMPFGVKMFTEGVILVGFGDIQTASGPMNPAKDAGLELGDVIVTVGGKKISGNNDLGAIVSAAGSAPLEVVYVRDDVQKTTTLIPAKAKDNSGYKAGMWVRDSSAGIGTVTYINPETGLMGGLGHAITDTDTGLVMPVQSGEFVEVSITGIKKGQFGTPGELNGVFYSDKTIATLEYNGETGVIGAVTTEFYDGSPIPVILKQNVQKGPAQILTTIDDKGPQYYDIILETVNLSADNPTKNIVIQITDPDLIAKTGGIIQGMSGSPIIQNGGIVGAVTHVFVNDPTKGYGIFIENMMQHEQDVENSSIQDAA